MSFLTSLLSDIDPSAAASGVRPAQPPRPTITTQRPAASNVASLAQPMKRKADGPPDGGPPKFLRKESTPTERTNGVARPPASSNVAKPKPATSTTTVPYRGTASIASSRLANATADLNGAMRKTSITPTSARPSPKPATSTPAKPSMGTAPSSSASTAQPRPQPQPKMGSYAAMLAKAKEKKTANPTVLKHEPTKILSKAERAALSAQTKGNTKAKTPGVAGNPKAGPVKGAEAVKDNKRKPVEVGYQGTARPKKTVEIGYKGTARPSGASAGLSAKKAVPSAAAKNRGKYGGYASWSDEDEEEVEEEDYESDESAMEGNIWDVEEEEKRALAEAKKEDAIALAEELRLKREKEERKRKLQAMNKAAAAKQKY